MSLADDRMCEKLLLAKSTRNRKWGATQKAHLAKFPTCAACGESNPRKLVVHHIKPYQWFNSLELDEDNLITLCKEDHFTFGHLKRYASWNPNVVEMCANYRLVMRNRPKWNQMI